MEENGGKRGRKETCKWEGGWFIQSTVLLPLRDAFLIAWDFFEGVGWDFLGGWVFLLLEAFGSGIGFFLGGDVGSLWGRRRDKRQEKNLTELWKGAKRCCVSLVLGGFCGTLWGGGDFLEVYPGQYNVCQHRGCRNDVQGHTNRWHTLQLLTMPK